MTEKDVLERVRKIMNCRADYEAAHGMEDELHRDVLRAIANGECEDAPACAEVALSTAQIVFARWCA